MQTYRAPAIVLAASELLPAEPGDLSGVLSDPRQREALLRLSPDEHSSPLTAYLCAEIDMGRVERWEKRLETYASDDADLRLVLAGDPAYPTRLADCWDRPPFLFVKGWFKDAAPAIAIVGSRDTSPEACEQAHAVSAAMASKGISVVSGLALGIDTAAHQGALEANGHTVAVLGTGMRQIYPPRNGALADVIARKGALVSQFTPDGPRTGTSFLRRNSVIAGLADFSLVMDGRSRSGSRHEGEQSLRYGKKTLLWAPTLGGEQWAQEMAATTSAIFVSTVDEVASILEAACL
ncbi:DNA-processing protein DprA [Blastococcus sp. SYSU DS0753]